MDLGIFVTVVDVESVDEGVAVTAMLGALLALLCPSKLSDSEAQSWKGIFVS